MSIGWVNQLVNGTSYIRNPQPIVETFTRLLCIHLAATYTNSCNKSNLMIHYKFNFYVVKSSVNISYFTADILHWQMGSFPLHSQCSLSQILMASVSFLHEKWQKWKRLMDKVLRFNTGIHQVRPISHTQGGNVHWLWSHRWPLLVLELAESRRLGLCKGKHSGVWSIPRDYLGCPQIKTPWLILSWTKCRAAVLALLQSSRPNWYGSECYNLQNNEYGL